ncbi:competence protein CoiA [Enterococcus dongliensis]|uniref:competence protein CoiA n=1 Tax=Enterococcus dongliensis TaxID=2559925 RepID=UPI0028904C05|nr:competence protein CoiA family protein [Enterococcus dongliensis]MDT2673205.1 competence protein CoiA family protein [Enterococcus dongliensis]
MLFAYTEEKKMVSAAETTNKSCFCPDCGSLVIRKAGKIKIPHFAHATSTKCLGLSEGETFEHLQLKQLFFKWGNHFETGWKMEAPLIDLNQRPDLLFGKLAVEIQCSAINGRRLAQRMTGYRQKEYQNWWLLGEQLWTTGRFTQLQRQFCAFDQAKGIHLWLLEKNQIRLRYHICEEPQLIYREICWPSYTQSLQEIFQSTVFERPLPLFPTIENRNKWKQTLSMKLVQNHPQIRRLQQYFYQERWHLLYLPDWLYFPSRYYFFYQEDLLVFRYLFQKEAKNAPLIFRKFLNYRTENQREWIFHQIDQQEILERLYLEAIFLSKKG